MLDRQPVLGGPGSGVGGHLLAQRLGKLPEVEAADVELTRPGGDRLRVGEPASRNGEAVDRSCLRGLPSVILSAPVVSWCGVNRFRRL
jgi:hypothetical protein